METRMFCRVLTIGVAAIALQSAAETAWRYRWPGVIPEVAEKTLAPENRVTISNGVAVEVACAETPKAAAEWFSGKMELWFGCKPFVRVVDAGDMPDGDESYVLGAKDGKLFVRARTMQGIRWAAMTLRQIAQPARGTFTVRAYEVPEFTVRDKPEISFRALHLCAFPEVTPARLEHGIRMAAYYKFNYLILESWGVYKSKKHPWYGWKNGWMTLPECRRLAATAKDLGVTIIPFFNIFGHARAARGKAGKHAALDLAPQYQPLFEPRAGFNWCLANPESVRVIREMVTEMHEAFGSPAYFHLGCDEADPPTCAACCAADYGKLLASLVESLSAHVRKLGARPMIWHDKLIMHGDPRWKGFEANGDSATVTLLDRLPKDVIICDWCYYPTPKDGLYPTLDYFRSKGFETMTCPWDDIGGIHSQCAYARKAGMGVVCTTWNRFTDYSVWSTFSHGASCAWSAKAAGDVKVLAKEYSSALRDVYDTHWRQVGWDTPGVDRYSETGFFTDQIGTSIGTR